MQNAIIVLGAEVPSGRAIAKKLRLEQFAVWLMASSATAAQVMAEGPAGIIIAGESSEGAHAPDPAILALDVPVLSLGSATQTLLGAIDATPQGDPVENAVMPVAYTGSPLFPSIDSSERLIVHANGYSTPEGYAVVAQSDGFPLGFYSESGRNYLFQFPIERNDPEGMAMLLTFAMDVCGLSRNWTIERITEASQAALRAAVGDGQAICALSGGLDSTVASMLATRALGDRVHCVFIDTGLLREGEADETEHYFRDELKLNFMRVDASDAILKALHGLISTEEKSAVINNEITRALIKSAERIEGPVVFVKGTNYVDVLHGRPEWDTMRESVVEPLRDLFKEEIRSVGNYLGLSDDLLSRQPFPGMGLAARIDGEVTHARVNMLRRATALFQAELHAFGQMKRLSRYFAMLDQLNDRDAIILRATYGNEPNMSVARLPHDLLERVVENIKKELPSVVRVLYDITPGHAEWQ